MALEMMLIEMKEHSKKCDGPVWFYRVTDATTLDVRDAMRVVFGTCGDQGPGGSKIRDLPARAEYSMLRNARAHICACHKSGIKCMLVIELTNFPLVVVYVDRRDQIKMRDGEELDKFDHDVIHYWKTYDPKKEVPAVLTNANSGAGLKILKLS